MPSKYKYTDPNLRDQVKQEIHNSDKGGAPGQWSARKAQMMASEYKKRGGGYTTDKKDKDQDQKRLNNWTEEDWQTKDGSGRAKQKDGTEKRYLPKKAWEQMSDGEKERTDQKKQQGSKEGKQYVANTSKAKTARKNASREGEAKGDFEDDNNEKSRKRAKDCTHHWEDAVYLESGQDKYRDFMEEDGEAAEESKENAAQSDQSGSSQSEGQGKGSNSTKKRGRGANQRGSNKKQKNGGSSEDVNATAVKRTRASKNA